MVAYAQIARRPWPWLAVLLLLAWGVTPAEARKPKAQAGIAKDLCLLPKGATVVLSAKASVLKSKAILAMADTDPRLKARLELLALEPCAPITAGATVTYGAIRSKDAAALAVVVVGGITAVQFEACFSQKGVVLTQVKRHYLLARAGEEPQEWVLVDGRFVMMHRDGQLVTGGDLDRTIAAHQKHSFDARQLVGAKFDSQVWGWARLDRDEIRTALFWLVAGNTMAGHIDLFMTSEQAAADLVDSANGIVLSAMVAPMATVTGSSTGTVAAFDITVSGKQLNALLQKIGELRKP